MKILTSAMLFLAAICLYSQNLELMDIQSKLQFAYDDSGNQIERKFSTFKTERPDQSEEPETEFAIQFEDKIMVYPNPTQGLFYIEWEKEIAQYISSVEILSSDAVIQANKINSSVNKLNIDLTLKQNGIYFVRFTFTDGSIASKKVIKL